jgi:hypothetical protein
VARRTGNESRISSEAAPRNAAPSLDDVARRAYEFYEARGGEPGADLDDWLRAERELLGVRGPDADEI